MSNGNFFTMFLEKLCMSRKTINRSTNETTTTEKLKANKVLWNQIIFKCYVATKTRQV